MKKINILKNFLRELPIILFVIVIIAIVRFLFFGKMYYPEDQVIICLESMEELTKKNKAENDIILKNCREELVDYDNAKGTVLYLSDTGDLLELEIKTGEINQLDILEKVDEDIAGEKNENLHNLKYGPEKGEVSFTSWGNGLYVCKESQGKEEWVTDCSATYTKNTYEWKDEDTIYTILYDGGMQDSLYLWDSRTGTKEQIEQSVVSFTLSNDKKKIYGINLTGKNNGINIEMHYSISEKNIETGTWRELMALDTEFNFMLELIDDRYLVYVEECYNKKKSKVYCLDIETGEKKCIYKTKSKVVGVIWTGDEL